MIITMIVQQGGHELKNILDLFREKRHVIISGKPGSGKTTLSRSLINTLSSDNLTKMSETFGRRLPLYFKLRDYKIDEIKNYTDFLNQYIKSIGSISVKCGQCIFKKLMP